MVALDPSAQQAPPAERRTSRRRPLHELPDITDVKIQSERVDVVNASSGGVLIQCTLRLVPGAASLLEIVRVDGSVRVGGRVVRSELVMVSGQMQYRIAIAFDRPLAFIDQDGAETAVPLPSTDDVAHVIVLGAAAEPDLEQHLALNCW